MHLCFLYYSSCNQCGRESKLVSKFYELELNIQGHKQLTDCITEFLKVWAGWFVSCAVFREVFSFPTSTISFWGRCGLLELSCLSEMNAKGNAFL